MSGTWESTESGEVSKKKKKRKDCNKYFEKIQSKAKYLESKGGRVRRAP